jgi:hypothetical protein
MYELVECPHLEAKEAKRYYVKDEYDPSRQLQLCEPCYKLSGARAYMMAMGGPDRYEWVIGPPDR